MWSCCHDATSGRTDATRKRREGSWPLCLTRFTGEGLVPGPARATADLQPQAPSAMHLPSRRLPPALCLRRRWGLRYAVLTLPSSCVASTCPADPAVFLPLLPFPGCHIHLLEAVLPSPCPLPPSLPRKRLPAFCAPPPEPPAMLPTLKDALCVLKARNSCPLCPVETATAPQQGERLCVDHPEDTPVLPHLQIRCL